MNQDSTRLEPWIGMIRTLTFANRPSEAYTWIGRGLTLFPNSIELMALRAVNHARRGMVRRAMNNSDAALEQVPNLPLAHMARGEVLILAENKNYDFCFEQCIKLSAPGDWETPFLVGLILEERRLWGKAMTYYTTTSERFEHNPALWYHVGRCRAELGHGLKAEHAFEQARELCEAGDPLLARLRGARGGALWNRVRSLFRRT